MTALCQCFQSPSAHIHGLLCLKSGSWRKDTQPAYILADLLIPLRLSGGPTLFASGAALHLRRLYGSVGNKEWQIPLTIWNRTIKKKKDPQKINITAKSRSVQNDIIYGSLLRAHDPSECFSLLHSYDEPLITIQIWFQNLGKMIVYDKLCLWHLKCCKMSCYWFYWS